jgi:hypothetical protein
VYIDLLKESIVDCVIAHWDIDSIIKSVNPQTYKFLRVPANLISLLDPAPDDINTNIDDSRVIYYRKFLAQVNNWMLWYDKMTTILIPVFHWLKCLDVENAISLYADLCRSRDKSKVTMTDLGRLVQKTFTIIQPFKDLQRLCSMLNCLVSFQILNQTKINQQNLSPKFIVEVKRFHPNSFFEILARQSASQVIKIQERQRIQFFIASEQLEINVKVTFTSDDNPEEMEVLFQGDKVAVDKHTLEGEFETLKSGILTIEVKNEQGGAQRKVWFRVKQTSLSKSHIFEGIFSMIYSSACGANGRLASEKDVATVLESAFHFVDSLLDGQIKLKDMIDLKAMFRNRNINVRDEVKKLFSHRSKANHREGRVITAEGTEEDIEQVCEWLQIYQYYSYISIIITCVQKFNIISDVNTDQTIDSIKNLSDENCSLKDITENYRNLKQRFQHLTSQHLQLIKTASDCPNVIEMMTQADLYTTHGRRRFQELRDNLTTQFQLQERNNMILNSWIIIYGYCEPFTMKAQTLEEFIDSVAKLPYFEDIPETHMQSKKSN